MQGWLHDKLDLDRWLGAAHARYIAQLMRMFDRGDLSDALRHAVPLSKDDDPTPGRLGLRLPSPRSSLSLGFGRRANASGGSVGVGESLFAQLQRYYRSAYERLAAQGKIDEAAFVLADLLDQVEEAVAFLERHGRLETAAKLAESRELRGSLVVRQWILAGNWERAVRIARVRDAFADAIAMLESDHADAASRLRLLWGDLLASSGNFAQAVDVVWEVPGARDLAATWVDRGIELGGVAGARMLAKGLVLLPRQANTLLGSVRKLMDDESDDRAPQRRAFADALRTAGPGRAVHVAATMSTRALLRDGDALRSPIDPKLMGWLSERAHDPALRGDMPALPQARRLRLRARGSPLVIDIPADDRGAIGAHAAVAVAQERLLVALGDAGVWMLDANGRRLATFELAAEDLVPSVTGDRAITIARRGGVTTLGRIDVGKQTCASWCEAPLGLAYAPSFDGGVWFAGVPRTTVAAIDVFAPRLSVLWRVTDLVACCIRVDASNLWIVGEEELDHVQVWSYRRPDFRLRSRVGVPNEWHPTTLDDRGTSIQIAREDDVIRVLRGLSAQAMEYELESQENLLQPHFHRDWVIVTTKSDDDCCVRLLSGTRRHMAAKISLRGAQRCRVTTAEDAIVIADDLGRLLVLDIENGRVQRDLRLAP